jgi:hypothetical protein
MLRWFYAAGFVCATATAVSALELGKEQESWSICSVPTAQFRLQVPASLIHSAAPTATGCTFQSPDGEFNVEAVVQTAGDNETLENRMQKEIELLSGKVDRKKKGDDWFLLSGMTPDGTEYFRKLFTQNGQWVTLRITYPHTASKKYDAWVKRIEKTFVPFAPAQ